jgi:hypothetical protein
VLCRDHVTNGKPREIFPVLLLTVRGRGRKSIAKRFDGDDLIAIGIGQCTGPDESVSHQVGCGTGVPGGEDHHVRFLRVEFPHDPIRDHTIMDECAAFQLAVAQFRVLQFGVRQSRPGRQL